MCTVVGFLRTALRLTAVTRATEFQNRGYTLMTVTIVGSVGGRTHTGLSRLAFHNISIYLFAVFHTIHLCCVENAFSGYVFHKIIETIVLVKALHYKN